MFNVWQKVLRGAIATNVVLATTALLATAAGAQTLDRIQQNGAVNLGYLADSAPFSSGASSKPAGYAIDVCQRVVDALKVKLGRSDLQVNYVPGSEIDGLNAVANGQLDLLCGPVAETLERRATVSFSTPFFAGGVGAVVHGQAPQALLRVLNGEVARTGPTWRATVNQGIANHTFAIRTGTISAEEVRAKITQLGVVVKVIEVGSTAEGVTAVAERKADAFFDDRRALEGALKTPGLTSVALIQRYFTVGPYAMALPRGDEDFRLLVDTVVSRLMESAEFTTLFSNYFGAPGDNAKLLIEAYSLP